MPIDLERAHFNMVEQQVRPWEVLDEKVLEALHNVKREDFVPAAHRRLAYADLEIPLAHGECMMKPVVEGRMLQALDIKFSDAILEIGTGTGYITACLAALGREVTSIDLHQDFIEEATRKLQEKNVANAQLQVADAMRSFECDYEFDAICVTGAAAAMPEKFKKWMKPAGGRMFIVTGDSPAMQAKLVTRLDHGNWVEETLFETDLRYLAHASPIKQFTF